MSVWIMFGLYIEHASRVDINPLPALQERADGLGTLQDTPRAYYEDWGTIDTVTGECNGGDK